MSTEWSELRGTELSAFAASPAAKNKRSEFVRHLRAYGSQTDFDNFINQQNKPVEKCVEWYSSHPTAAHQWLLTALRCAPNQGKTHFLVAFCACTHHQNIKKINAPLEELINSVDFSTIDSDNLGVLLPHLLTAGLRDVVEKNWTLYEPLVRQNLEPNIVLFASFGWDLQAKIAWSPSTVAWAQRYFIQCCAGGLLHRVKQNPMEPTQTQVLLHAFYHAARNAPHTNAVLQYLWDTYPVTPWYKVDRAVRWAHKFPPTLGHDFVQQVKTAPKGEEMLAAAVAQCVSSKDTETIAYLFPYVDPRMHHRLVGMVAESRNTTVLQQILAHPKGEKQFLQGVKNLSPAYKTRAEDMRVVLQHRVLSKELKAVKSKSVPKRKM